MMLRSPRPRCSLVSALALASLLGGCGSSTSMPAGATGGATAATGGSSGATGGSASGGASGATGGRSVGGASGSTGGTSGGTSLSGTLGTLGAVQPTVSALWISNSGETLVYLSSAALTCDQLMVSRWLGSTTTGSQVVELVIKGAPKVSDYPVPPGEVNYAQGGKSSSYEVVADSGKISFTKADAQVVEGSIMATYSGKSISGQFHAEFCANGQGY